MRFLPLSQQDRRNESGIASDRRAAVADLLLEAARLLRNLPAATAASAAEMFLEDADLARDFAGDAQTGAQHADLASLAERVRAGRRRSVAVLTRTLRAVLVLSDRLGAVPQVDAVTSGAVALYAATTASFDRRAAIAGNTVRATDAEWEFGHGPVIEGPALGIVAFLVGIADIPPRRPSSDS
jgi:hypothetical protein